MVAWLSAQDDGGKLLSILWSFWVVKLYGSDKDGLEGVKGAMTLINASKELFSEVMTKMARASGGIAPNSNNPGSDRLGLLLPRTTLTSWDAFSIFSSIPCRFCIVSLILFYRQSLLTLFLNFPDDLIRLDIGPPSDDH